MGVGAILPPSPRVEHHWNVSGSLNAKKRGLFLWPAGISI